MTWNIVATLRRSRISFCFKAFFCLVIFGDSGWWKNSCWSQLWISMVGKSGFLMLLQFVTSSMLHLISIACWIMLIHVDKLFVKHILFLFLRVFLCKPCGAQGQVLEVSMKYQWLMTWSYQYGRNYRSLADVLSLDSYRGMPNADSGVGVATKMFSKSSRKHVEQSKSKGQKSRHMRSESVLHTQRCLIFWCSIEKFKAIYNN